MFLIHTKDGHRILAVLRSVVVKDNVIKQQ